MTGPWSSGLSHRELAAVRAVGLDPVGRVSGSTVHQIGWSGGGGCGVYGGPGAFAAPVFAASPWRGYEARVTALYDARRRAVRRLTEECAALGGDGVVGVQVTLRPYPGALQAQELTVTGTAVRARGRVHPPAPFLCDLSGQDVAALLLAGWVPCGLVFGVAVGVRHADVGSRGGAYGGLGSGLRNRELPRATELVQDVRAQVRRRIEDDVRRQGGEGLVVREMTLQQHEQECQALEGQQDHVAEATLFGTALVPFARRPQAPTPLRVLRLDQLHEAVLGQRLSTPQEEFR